LCLLGRIVGGRGVFVGSLPRDPCKPSGYRKDERDERYTAEDLRNRERRKDYLAAIRDMLDQTDTRWAPWTVIDGNDKKAARIAALTRVADVLADALPAEPPPIRLELARLAQKAFKDEG